MQNTTQAALKVPLVLYFASTFDFATFDLPIFSVSISVLQFYY
jgi:hypothetical protein